MRVIIPIVIAALLVGLAVGGGTGCRGGDLPQVTAVPPEILQPFVDEQATDDAALTAGTMTHAQWRINFEDRQRRLNERFIGYMTTHRHRPIVTQVPDAPPLVWPTCEELYDDCLDHLSDDDCWELMIIDDCLQGGLFFLEYPIAYYSSQY
jgi:hypothetical protein